MTPDRTLRNLAPGSLALGLALVVLLLGEGLGAPAPARLVEHPGELAALVVLAALAALHRPLAGVSLGFGAMVLPATAAELGAAAAGLVAGGAVALAEAARRTLGRRLLERSWRGGRTLETTIMVACSALIGAAVWRSVEAPVGGTLAAAAAHCLSLLGLRLAGGRLRGGRAAEARAPLGLAVDAAGWIAGGVVIAAAPGDRAWPPLVLLALLAAEAARQRLLRELSEHRVAGLRRVHRAHHRILAETSELGGIAEQILAECRNVLPVAFFQLEVLGVAGEHRSWSSGPDGQVSEGVPRPPRVPPALPGIHRRAAWKVLEKPLEADGEILAELRLWCDPRRIEPGDEELLASLLPQMASSLHRARLDREAKLDPLTGVPVRRVLEARLGEAYRRSCEDGRPMAVVMCDVDFFKRINDTHGHAAGDEALRLVARTLDAERRERDLCCRYGGEEFTLLLEDTPGHQALRLAERLRREVEALEMAWEGREVPLRLSAGVAAFPELHVRNGQELLELADDALYRAKQTGRNRCLLSQGQGRYRAADGRPLEAEGAPPPPAVPRIFD